MFTCKVKKESKLFTGFPTLHMRLPSLCMQALGLGYSTVWANRLSLRAFIDNIGPMLVYSVTFMLLAILASIPMMLGWLVLMPLVFTSLYACYCDIFPTAKEGC